MDDLQNTSSIRILLYCQRNSDTRDKRCSERIRLKESIFIPMGILKKLFITEVYVDMYILNGTLHP